MYRAGTDVVAKAAFFLVTVAAARTLSPQSFGLFSLASTVGWMTAVACDFGIQMHLARAVALEPQHAGALLARWLPVRILTALLGTAAVAAGALLTLPATAAGVLILLTLTYAVTGLTECIYYLFRGLGRSDLESSFVALQRLLLLALAIAVLAWTRNLTALAIAMLVPAGLALSAALIVARRLSGPVSSLASWPRGIANEAMTQVVPIGAGIVVAALYFRVDIFMIGAWLGSEAAGRYNAVFRIVEALRLFPAAVLAVAMPALCVARTRRPLVQIASLLAGGGMLVAVVLWLVSGRLVPWLYGAAFADAAAALRVLALAFPLMAVNYALTQQLIGWHGHRRYAWLCVVALAANVAANTAAIPALGIVGAAWTTLLTELLVTILCVHALLAVERRSPGTAAMAVSA
jgi:O-antigen/teichoic acid export membrane protein